MLITWKELHDVQEAANAVHQLTDGGTTMISGDGVMECFPKPLDALDPGVVLCNQA